jgi:hypothetical protein
MSHIKDDNPLTNSYVRNKLKGNNSRVLRVFLHLLLFFAIVQHSSTGLAGVCCASGVTYTCLGVPEDSCLLPNARRHFGTRINQAISGRKGKCAHAHAERNAAPCRYMQALALGLRGGNDSDRPRDHVHDEPTTYTRQR